MESPSFMVTADAVLLSTTPFLARSAGAVASQDPAEANFLTVIAGDLAFIHFALDTIRGFGAAAQLRSQDYITARENALPFVDFIISNERLIGIRDRIATQPNELQRLKSIKFAPGLRQQTTYRLCDIYCILDSASNGHLGNFYDTIGGALLRSNLTRTEQVAIIRGVHALRRELFQILEEVTSQDKHPTWNQTGSEKTQRDLNLLSTAVASTWNNYRPTGRQKKLPQLGHASYVNLLMDGTWSRNEDGTGSFALVFASPHAFQEAIVDIRKTSQLPLEKWRSACRLPISKLLCYDFMLNRNGQIGTDEAVVQNKTSSSKFHAKAKEFTLSEVLNFRELHYREKMVLCLHIARCLLDLQPTSLLRQNWGTDDIRVYGWTTDNSAHLDLRHPYLSLKLPLSSADIPEDAKMASQDAESDSESLNEMHRFPHALGLGVVLMQILLGDRLQNLEPFQSANDSENLFLFQNITDDINSKLVQAWMLKEACEARFPKESALMRAISQCADSGMFGPLVPVDDHPRVFREDIIFPLERAILREDARPLTNAGLDKFLDLEEAKQAVLGNMDDLFGEENTRKRSHSQISRETSALGDSWISTSGSHVMTLETTESLVELTEKFLKPVEKISQALLNLNNRLKINAFRRKDVWDGAVRVAILDTGCDFRLEEINQLVIGKNDDKIAWAERSAGIVGWKDFVDRSRKPEDYMVDESENRHGTIMTHLFLRTMGHAKVYIGRVIKGDLSNEARAPERVAEAVEWAEKIWKADIISISLSLEKASEEIRNQINEVSKRTLIFAAAGNDRQPSKKPIAFPASSGSVICVHSHDGHGKPSLFTPNAQKNAPNFQVVGQDLRIPGLGGHDAIVNGTSCATPVAAGIAACVIDFVRACRSIWMSPTAKHPDSALFSEMRELFIKRYQRLNNEQVMKRILYDCMTDRDLGGYNMINPEKLFDLEDRNWEDNAIIALGKVLKADRDDTYQDPRHL